VLPNSGLTIIQVCLFRNSTKNISRTTPKQQTSQQIGFAGCWTLLREVRGRDKVVHTELD